MDLPPPPFAAGPGDPCCAGDLTQLRLFLEEICCEICRFRHVAELGLAPERIKVFREVYLGRPGVYADIKVQLPGQPAAYLEVKYGYPLDRLLDSLRRKYSAPAQAGKRAPQSLTVLVRRADYADWAGLPARLREVIRPDLQLEVWDEQTLFSEIDARFGTRIEDLDGGDLLAVRRAIDRAKWRLAFDQDADDEHLASTLLWHFSLWTLRRLHQDHGLAPVDILRPGLYREVAVVMADLCSFSAYVRDTRDDSLLRNCLTSFYSKARHAIHNTGGMLYQFVGDEVVGLYGLPVGSAQIPEDAIDGARALVDIGNSVTHHWQSQLDRVQQSGGVHIGLSLGNLNLVPLRPFSQNHLGVVGDAINMAARLGTEAGSGELVISNTLRQRLSTATRAGFQQIPPVEGKNIGLIRCWKQSLRPASEG